MIEVLLLLPAIDLVFVDCEIRTVCCADVPRGSVLVSDGVIKEVGDIVPPEGAELIRCQQGDVLTPGLIEADSTLGLSEILLEPLSNDAVPALAQPIRAHLDPRDALDPRSTLVGVARSHGVTSVVTMPSGGVVEGRAVWMDLVDERSRYIDTAYGEPSALSAHAGQQGGQAYGMSRLSAFGVLRNFFEDVVYYRRNKTAFLRNDVYQTVVSRPDLDAAVPVTTGDMPLLVEAHRAADITRVLNWANEAKIELILVGASEGHLVAEEIALAEVPVVVHPFENLPAQFERRQVRTDNAARLEAAGVRVMIATRSAHNAGNLRFVVGNAIRAGFPEARALEAVTARVAEAYGQEALGVVQAGARADLVLWSGDPFQPSTEAKLVLIRGERQTTDNRQRRLAERYIERLEAR
ncbi:MAG: amidohydrolase family protein [Myxococcota bacterium]